MQPLAEENMKMTDCYFEKKDWRQCKDEASYHLSITRWEEPFANLNSRWTTADGDLQTLLESSRQ